MKTITNILNTEKHLKIFFLLALFVFQGALKASDLPCGTTDVVNDTNQQVEDWMLDLSTWAKKADKNVAVDTGEPEIEIENWMIDLSDEVWKTGEEEELKIEEWMYNVDHCYWNGCADEEKEMEIENWMVDISQWESKCDLLSAASY
ncbi:MAG: hypothetical protein PVF73_13650 [Bacteroidales bacterium]